MCTENYTRQSNRNSTCSVMTNTTVLLRGAQSADGRAMYTQGDPLQFGSFYLGESSSTSGSTEATGMQIISRSLEDADIPADVTNVIMHPGDTVLTSSIGAAPIASSLAIILNTSDLLNCRIVRLNLSKLFALNSPALLSRTSVGRPLIHCKIVIDRITAANRILIIGTLKCTEQHYILHYSEKLTFLDLKYIFTLLYDMSVLI